MLAKFHLNKAHTVNTPMKETAILEQKTKRKTSPSERKCYQGMTGSIMFSIVETRPNITFATSVASHFAKNPSHQHTKTVKTILQYLKGSKNREITYKNQSKLKVEGYSDSNWAEDKESQKSILGFIFMLNGGLVSWCLKRQPTVTFSSIKAKYIALTLAVKEATWLQLLLIKLGFLQPDQQHTLIKVSEGNTCLQGIHQNFSIACGEKSKSRTVDGDIIISLKGDNQGPIALTHNPVFHSKTKHINIQYHYIRDKVASQRIKLSYVLREEMITDDFTKALTYVKFYCFIKQINMT